MMDALYEAQATSGTIVVYKNRVVLRYAKFIGSGKGEKEIRIKSITGIQLKKPGMMGLAGFIEFSFSGGSEAKGSLFVKDENRLIINTKAQYEQMVKVKDLVYQLLDQQDDHKPAANLSTADELAKFAELRDKGILTTEEFDAKKKQILGL